MLLTDIVASRNSGHSFKCWSVPHSSMANRRRHCQNGMTLEISGNATVLCNRYCLSGTPLKSFYRVKTLPSLVEVLRAQVRPVEIVVLCRHNGTFTQSFQEALAGQGCNLEHNRQLRKLISESNPNGSCTQSKLGPITSDNPGDSQLVETLTRKTTIFCLTVSPLFKDSLSLK